MRTHIVDASWSLTTPNGYTCSPYLSIGLIETSNGALMQHPCSPSLPSFWEWCTLLGVNYDYQVIFNSAPFRVRCVVARIMLSSPSFCGENIARRCHIFMAKIRENFALGCDTKHRQGFMSIYMACINMLKLRYTEAHQSTEHIMRVIYIGKPMSPSEAWICICSITLECIPTHVVGSI